MRRHFHSALRLWRAPATEQCEAWDKRERDSPNKRWSAIQNAGPSPTDGFRSRHKQAPKQGSRKHACKYVETPHAA